MQIILKVFDWDGHWHAYIEEIESTSTRRHARRRRLWTRSWDSMPPLEFTGVLEVLAAVLEEASGPAPCSPAERGRLPRGGHGGDPT